MSSGPACTSYRNATTHAVLQQQAPTDSPERTRSPLHPSNKNYVTPTKSGGSRTSPQRGIPKFAMASETPSSRPSNNESPYKMQDASFQAVTPSKIQAASQSVTTSKLQAAAQVVTPSKFKAASPPKTLAGSETLSSSSNITQSPARSPIKGTGTPHSGTSKITSHAADPALQKQYAEAIAKLSSITSDYKYLEEELAKKSTKVSELSQKLMCSEKMLRTMEEDRRKAREMSDREVAFYKESLDELQRMNLRLSSKLEANQASAEAQISENETKYLTLLRSYKALQSNLELEQNSKALLIDQIEYLTKERDFLLQNTNSHGSLEANSLDSEHIDILNNSDFPDSPNSDFDASDFESESNSDGSVRGTELMMSFQDLKPEDFDSSSPIKVQTLKQADFQKELPQDIDEGLLSPGNSFEVSQNFQFPGPPAAFRTPSFPGRMPPSPEQSAKTTKRQSLPAKFKSHEKPDLVLFPIKLASQANLSYCDENASAEGNSASHSKRHSTSTSRRLSKPGHSRYSSHDIVPIKVEFESEHNIGRPLSASAMQSELSSVAESRNPIKDSCDEAFMKLSGYGRISHKDSATACSSKRSSVISKRSSVWSEANLSSGDVTKQEITKLKFELQSLKLHNEKLLSYIGFELQKQKKNIKKLSSKQNLRGKNVPKGMEYSDAKLIERSREMLIHKKRVLRSVSINPTFSRTISNLDCVGLGSPALGNEEEDTFAFKSHFINSIHTPKESSSRGDFSMLDTQSVKKYKSQTFRVPNTQYFSSEDSEVSAVESGEELDMGIDETPREGGWDTSSDGSVSEVEFNNLNRFNQMRYMIFGKEHMKKEKEIETIADEGLKYKFLTIALGIIVVAVQVTSNAHHQSSR